MNNLRRAAEAGARLMKLKAGLQARNGARRAKNDLKAAGFSARQIKKLRKEAARLEREETARQRAAAPAEVTRTEADAIGPAPEGP
jgi:hypothetical protein